MICLIFVFYNQTEKTARLELDKWRQQIKELHDKCQAALYVMEEFKGNSINKA